jgi:lipoprotein-anchoring transpeptidase ErfK/SrfK
MQANSTSEARAVPRPLKSLPVALGMAAIALLLVAPSARGHSGSTVVWTPPTQADKYRFTVTAGSMLTFWLGASTSTRGATVDIEPRQGLPQGARVATYVSGRKSRAIFRWRPTVVGEYVVQFAASTGRAAAPKRTFAIVVTGTFPRFSKLTNSNVARWAPVTKTAIVRTGPRSTAPVLTTLETRTGDDTQNLVVVLDRLDRSPSETWYRVRLPILPNNSTGWVPKRFLGDLYTVNTHLYIDRGKLTATLKRNGVTVFQAGIGIGKAYWPTPAGEFYIRSKLTGFNSPVYGPVAFGTSARSAVLTDWPGGGFVGVHGTNMPQILPGQVSHGCIRMRNEDILKLAKLMQVGTPVTIR